MVNKVWEVLNKNYVNAGLKIFPCIKNGKTPAIKEWQNDCSANFMQILYWVENSKECNWGLPATPNNLFVIDLDRHDPNKDGVENFNKILKELGIESIDTLKQETPSGGIHLIFESDSDLKKVSNGSNVFENYPGIDLRSDGYIVVEPSSINDVSYKMYGINVPQKMPLKLKNFIIKNAGTKETKKKTPYVKPKEVEKGDRDNQLFSYINNLYFKTRLDYDEVLLLANNFNEEILEEPFTKREVTYKVKKAFQKDRGTCIFVKVGNEDE